MRNRSAALLAIVVAIAATASGTAPPAGAEGRDDAGSFHVILPPGQDGVANGAEAAHARGGGGAPPHATDQLERYAGLVLDTAVPGLAPEDLDDHFRDAPIDAPDDAGPAHAPGGRDDVTVRRDAWGVPHVEGTTREGTFFGVGYTTAEDKLFLMDVLRHVGRGQLSAFLGASESNLADDRLQLAIAPYTEQDLRDQVAALRDAGPAGAQVHADALAYSAGVNQYIQEALADPSKLPAAYPALQVLPDEWLPEDLVAVGSLITGQLAKAGGGEVANLCGLQELEEGYGDPDEARRVFDDLTFPDDPEAPTTTDRRFTYPPLAPVDPAAIPDLDCASLHPIEPPPPGSAVIADAVVDVVPQPPLPDGPEDAPGGSFARTMQRSWSNAVLVHGDHTTTGAPMASMGPQAGYWHPQLLQEHAITGPGIRVRGVGFTGVDLLTVIGRGDDHAYSTTTAFADNVDEVVLRLCEPGADDPREAATTRSMGYWFEGSCRPIEGHQDVQVAKPGAAGVPGSPDHVVLNRYFERAPDLGPLSARGTTRDGAPVAVATVRSTYGAEVASAPGLLALNDPAQMASGFDGFRDALDGVDFVINYLYLDREHIGYQATCGCPVPAEGVDPWLPRWGTGEWEPDRWLPKDQLPWDLDPDRGWLISWNNKEAPGFRDADDQHAFGSTHRYDLLERRLEDALADGPIDVGELVDATTLAATTDLRAQELVGLLGRVMGDRAPEGVDDRAQAMWDAVRAWANDDLGHRRDHDGDGTYEHATAIAVMDAWWGGSPAHPDSSRLFDAIFVEGRPVDARRALGLAVHDRNLGDHIGSAFQDAAYAHVHKALRQVLGDDVDGPMTRTWCGDGDLALCRDRLWRSLSDTAPALAAEFDSASVADWRRVISDDELRFRAVGVVEVPAIPWQNRPTYHQVVAMDPLGTDEGPDGDADGPQGDDDPGTAADRRAPLPATGGGVGIAVLAVAALAARRRHGIGANAAAGTGSDT